MKRLSILSVFALAVCVSLFAAAPEAAACDYGQAVQLVQARSYFVQPAIVQQRVLVDRQFVGGNSVNIVNAGRGRGANVIQASAGGGGGANVNIVNQRSGLFGLRSTQVIQASAGR